MAQRFVSPARALAVAVVVLGACGEAGKPPPPGELGADAGGDDAGGVGSFGDASLLEKSCGIGPDGGVCACVDQPLVLDPPTLYYVLDRSGSMQDPLPGSGNQSKWRAVGNLIEGLTIDIGPRAKFGIAVFPDPWGDVCVPGQQVFAPTQGDGAFGMPGPVDLQIGETLGKFAPFGGTPTAATLQSLLPQLTAPSNGRTYAILATDGGANCDSAIACTTAGCTANIESVGCEVDAGTGCCPAGANCCDPQNGGGPQDCLDAQATTDAVRNLFDANVPVYVIGLPGSQNGADATLLADLASTGGTGTYYPVADQNDLLQALSTIAAKVAASCTLTLDHVPPDPTRVNVWLGGKLLPQPGPDGWTLKGATVTLLGASCKEVLSGQVLDVRVVAGCPTVMQ